MSTAAAAAFLLTGGSASADVPSVPLQICNNAGNAQSVKVSGTSQKDVSVATGWFQVQANKCHTVEGKFKIGSNVLVSHKLVNTTPVTDSHFTIASNSPAGKLNTATITANGPA